MSTLTITERVAAGAAWMDEHVPGWTSDIDLAELDMADSCRCVRGQALGDYKADPWPEDKLVPFGMSDLGFDTGPGETYRDLRIEWSRLIQVRREQAGAES